MTRPYDERPKFESIPQALDLLRKAVQTRGGDYKYVRPEGSIGCVYVHEGSCSCLIGVALHLLGWTVEEIEQLDTRGPLGNGVACLVDKITAATREGSHVNAILAAAQGRQDNGDSWNEALTAALRAAWRNAVRPTSTENEELFEYAKTLYLVEAK